MSLFEHDTRTFVDEYGYDSTPVEPGDYNAMIIDAGEKTSTTTGVDYAYIKLEILDGRFKGRRMYDNMFLNSPNAKAVTIAKKKLNAICKSVGIESLTSPVELLNKKLVIRVAYDKMDTARNIVTGYASGSPMPHMYGSQTTNNTPTQSANIPF